MRRLELILAFLILLARDASAGKYNYDYPGKYNYSSYRCGDSCPPMPTWAIVFVTLLVVGVFGGTFCWWWFIKKEHSCPDCSCFSCYFFSSDCCNNEPDYSEERRQYSLPKTRQPKSELNKYIKNPSTDTKPPVPDDVESGNAASAMPPPPSYDLVVGDVTTPFITPNDLTSQPSSIPTPGNSSLPYAVSPSEQPLFDNDPRPVWVDPKSEPAEPQNIFGKTTEETSVAELKHLLK